MRYHNEMFFPLHEIHSTQCCIKMQKRKKKICRKLKLVIFGCFISKASWLVSLCVFVCVHVSAWVFLSI